VTFTLSGFAYCCALVLAGVFLVSGAGKLAWRDETRIGFEQLGLPRPRLVAAVLPVVELVLAIGLIALPTVGAAAALLLIGGFTAFLIRLLRQGVDAPCGCIGSPHGSTPVSRRALLRNAGLAALAVSALFAVPTLPSAPEIALTVALVAAGWTLVTLRLPAGVPGRA
jgi:hypothetical protein